MSRIVVASVCAAFFFVTVAAADPDAFVGKWWTDGKQSVVEIAKAEDTYHGRIVWLQDPLYEEGDPEAGKPLRDRNNPDKEKQHDPILGLPLLKAFTFNEKDGSWENGTVYDPENGRTYKCVIRLEGNTLKVRGYIGSPILGRTTEWTRVTEEEAKKLEEGAE